MNKLLLCSSMALCVMSLSATIPPGNGVIIDSVASDLYNAQNGQSPSLKSDLQAAPQSNIQYLFPDIGYISVAESADIANGKAVNASTAIEVAPAYTDLTQGCAFPAAPSTSNTVEFYYTLCAVPQINGMDELGSKTTLPDLVKYYKTLPGSAGESINVIPLLSYDSEWVIDIQKLYNDQNPKLTTALTLLATEIGTTIAANASNNIGGAAFDNEPAINQLDGNQTASGIEYGFFKTIATALAKNNQNLFLFDANITVKNLYTVAPVSANVVALYPLYDFESSDADSGYSYGPYPFSAYSNPSLNATDVYHTVENGMNLGVPILFVLPGSATQTIWDAVEQYDLHIATIPPASPVNPNLTITSNCQAAPPQSVDTTVLSNFLCMGSDCPGGLPAVFDYIAPVDCQQYTRNDKGSVLLVDYFNAALDALPTSLRKNPLFLGAVLYSWRIPSFDDFNCAKRAPNIYQQKLAPVIQACPQVFPAEISPPIWAAFQTWASES